MHHKFEMVEEKLKLMKMEFIFTATYYCDDGYALIGHHTKKCYRNYSFVKYFIPHCKREFDYVK